jgi:hypothetical protein
MRDDVTSTNQASRRAFMAAGMTGVAAAAMAPGSFAAGSTTGGLPKNGPIAWDPRAKLRTISSRAKQMWPVIYIDPTNINGTLERDVDASFEGGADAVILEIGKNVETLRKACEHARRKYPTAKIGVNYLGDADGGDDLYGYKAGFKLAKDYNLDIVWVDFCGVDLIKELPEISLHEIEAARAPNAFYVSGVHMKYGTLLDPNKTLEQSALQAMGWVEGIIITGPRTGIPTDPDRARRARQVVGTYPLGLASGVSAENFPSVAAHVDYCLVNTSIADENHRIIKAKVRELRAVMG